jgi:spermidine/putrescine transport system permease protein
MIRKYHRPLSGVALLVPVIMIEGSFLLSLAAIFIYSFCQRGPSGEIVYEATLDNYVRLVTDASYLRIVFRSSLLAASNTIACLLLGYPVAYCVATTKAPKRNILLAMLILPFSTNFLIRSYAWILILRTEGFLNSALSFVHLSPLDLLFTQQSVFIGLLYNYLPFMILPIYAALHRFDNRLLDAAHDLGASSMRSFWTITLPLSRSGVVAGCLLVFIPSLGEFVVPDLLGGAKNMMIGNLIKMQFLESRDWPQGAALTMSFVALTLVGLLTYRRLSNKVASGFQKGGI